MSEFQSQLYLPEMEDFIAFALEEGNYYTGYKKIITTAGLDKDVENQGLEVVRKATNAVQGIYRLKKERETAQNLKRNDIVKHGLGLSREVIDAHDKTIRKLEHKILAYGYDITLLREPLEDFLYESGIPKRAKWNKKS